MNAPEQEQTGDKTGLKWCKPALHLLRKPSPKRCKLGLMQKCAALLHAVQMQQPLNASFVRACVRACAFRPCASLLSASCAIHWESRLQTPQPQLCRTLVPFG